MYAGTTRKGKKIFKVWQVKGSQHELITGSVGYGPDDHLDAMEVFHRLAANELGENGPTEFYHQYCRLQKMHKLYLDHQKRNIAKNSHQPNQHSSS